MLGSTAGRLYWMFRNLERSENTARLIEAGLNIALTRSAAASDEWASVVATAGSTDAYRSRYDTHEAATVVDFLLRDPQNPASVRSLYDVARENARGVRTALTRELWESINESWMTILDLLEEPLATPDLPAVLRMIKRESAYVRGSMHGTMTRNENHDFARLGTFVERADNTARILDVKYYLLLPSSGHVGSRLDSVQWDTILRAVSARRAYRWTDRGEINPPSIAKFLILDPQMPRSLLFCYRKIFDKLVYLDPEGALPESRKMADQLRNCVERASIGSIFDQGLHEFLRERIQDTADLSAQIELDFRFHP